MEKPTLSPQGVAEVTASLYELSTTELEAEALLIRSDIAGWIISNFETTTEQETFLNGLDPSYLDALGEQAARAVRHRWPVIYIAHAPEQGLRSAKWIKSKEEDEAGSGGSTKSTAHTGVLTIETGY